MANNLLTSVEGHWTMDEVTNRLDDVNGNTASPGTNPIQAVGLLGNAAENPAASNRHLVITNDSALIFSGNEDFTLAAWIRKATSSDTSGGFISLWEAEGDFSYSILYNNSTDKASFAVSSDGTTGGQTVVSSSGTLTNNVWYHVVGVHDATADTLSLYVTPSTDSVPASPATTAHSTGVHGDATDPIRMFLLPSIGEFPGRIDEVAVWRRALVAADITAHFNGGSPLPYAQWQLGASVSANTIDLPLHHLKARKRTHG
jgi:hypothetical protein